MQSFFRQYKRAGYPVAYKIYSSLTEALRDTDSNTGREVYQTDSDFKHIGNAERVLSLVPVGGEVAAYPEPKVFTPKVRQDEDEF